MNIFRRELKAGFKPFLFWSLGLFVLVFAGSAKFSGLQASGASFREILDSFPRIVQAVFGMAGLDITTFGGYYAVLSLYALICAGIYAVHLGGSAVSRESMDKTYEFVFTKPRSRSHILSIKLLAGVLYLLAFCVLDFAFSMAAVSSLKLTQDYTSQMALFAVSVFLISLVFFSFAALFAAAISRAQTGAKLGNTCVLVAFVLSVVYDMLENGDMIKILTPFKYFAAADLLENRLDPVYLGVCIVLTIVSLTFAFISFEKRDLTAA